MDYLMFLFEPPSSELSMHDMLGIMIDFQPTLRCSCHKTSFKKGLSKTAALFVFYENHLQSFSAEGMSQKIMHFEG